jgi:MT0933-like antitoxin protein
MPDFGDLADKAKDLASEHPDQVDEGLKRAGEFTDEKTGGRFGDQIQQGEQRADEYLGGQGDQGGGQDQSGGAGAQDQGGNESQ